MSSVSSRSTASRVLLDQVQIAWQQPHDYMDIYVSETNMGFWKVVMRGRPATPYARGIFLAYVEIGDDFPLKPPALRFITPIMHPNVSKHGRVCHQVFDKGWDPSFSVLQVLQHVWDMLVLTESTDAIDPISTVRFYTDPESAKTFIDRYITRFALKSSKAHRLEICGPESSNASDTSSVKSSVSGSVTGSAKGTRKSQPRLTRESLATIPKALTSTAFQGPSRRQTDLDSVSMATADMIEGSTTASSDDSGTICNVETPSSGSSAKTKTKVSNSRRLSFFRQFE